MSCSISSTVTSSGSAATVARISCRSASGTPAAGSSSSSTRGRQAMASAISSSRCLPYGRIAVRSFITSASWKRSSSVDRSPRSLPGSLPTRRHQSRAQFHALGDREPERLERRQVGEQLVDLERAREAEPHALVRLESVMSWPSSRMRPAVGASTPVSRLMSVVLPAPFGPISAWRAPFSTAARRRWSR